MNAKRCSIRFRSSAPLGLWYVEWRGCPYYPTYRLWWLLGSKKYRWCGRDGCNGECGCAR